MIAGFVVFVFAIVSLSPLDENKLSLFVSELILLQLFLLLLEYFALSEFSVVVIVAVALFLTGGGGCVCGTGDAREFICVGLIDF